MSYLTLSMCEVHPFYTALNPTPGRNVVATESGAWFGDSSPDESKKRPSKLRSSDKVEKYVAGIMRQTDLLYDLTHREEDEKPLPNGISRDLVVRE